MVPSASDRWQVGQFTGLNISPFQSCSTRRTATGSSPTARCASFGARSSRRHARTTPGITGTYRARRDYNAGRHYADPPAAPSVAYDRFGDPIGESRGSKALHPASSAPSGLSATPPVVPSQNRQRVDPERLTTNIEATAQRLAALQTHVDAEVLGPNAFRCRSYTACRDSHEGSFFEGQLHHVGQHYDLSVDGRPLRIVIVGQEYANGPSRVTLADRYQDIPIRSGLQKRFKSDGLYEGRNNHMRGTTSVLRLLLGRNPGERYDEEFWDIGGRRIHVFDMFALVNFLLCSAIDAKESATGSKHGRSTPIMRRHCGRHFVRAIEILEPTVVIVQRKDVLRWMASIMTDERVQSETLRNARIGNHRTLIATLSHPSAQGTYNWATLSRPYLQDVVVPTVMQARRVLLGEFPARVYAGE